MVLKKTRITGFQFLAINHRPYLALLPRRARQQDADGLLENELHQTAAVKTEIGIGTAHAVVDADQFQSLENQILSTVGVALEERRIFRKPVQFVGVDRTDTRESDQRGGEKGGEEVFSEHRDGIYVKKVTL